MEQLPPRASSEKILDEPAIARTDHRALMRVDAVVARIEQEIEARAGRDLPFNRQSVYRGVVKERRAGPLIVGNIVSRSEVRVIVVMQSKAREESRSEPPVA